MTGLAAGLLDALLAARLAPRLDVLGIKAEAAIGAPGPAVAIGKVDNDVRLPSHAALDRQLPGAVVGGAGHAAAGAPSSVSARLSVAARVIGAVLADLQAQPGPVRGAVPLLASGGQPASAAALAGALARTVSDSGLFYESHLAEFAAGGRTLAQMKQEPQARWASPVIAVKPDAAASMTPATVVLQDVLPLPLAQPPASVPQGDAPRAASVAVPQAPAAGAQPQQDAAHSQASGQAVSNDAARVQAAYRQPGSTPLGGTLDSQPSHRAAESAGQSDSVGAAPALRAAEVIHPQAVTLVHQQLDLLAGAVFRWSGQAWPDVPMAWSIEQEHEQEEARSDARGAAATQEEGTRRWSTTVSLVLPRLGEVDLRLSLDGPGVQAHVFARETSTMARLRGDAGRLAKRFDAAGLRLQQLQVMAKADA